VAAFPGRAGFAGTGGAGVSTTELVESEAGRYAVASRAAVRFIRALHFGQRAFFLVQPGGNFSRAPHDRHVRGNDMSGLTPGPVNSDRQYNRSDRPGFVAAARAGAPVYISAGSAGNPGCNLVPDASR
jgi:hypothetical protein